MYEVLPFVHVIFIFLSGIWICLFVAFLLFHTAYLESNQASHMISQKANFLYSIGNVSVY